MCQLLSCYGVSRRYFCVYQDVLKEDSGVLRLKRNAEMHKKIKTWYYMNLRVDALVVFRGPGGKIMDNFTAELSVNILTVF